MSYPDIIVTEKSKEQQSVTEAEMALIRAERRYGRILRELLKEQTDLRRKKEQAAAEWENERLELEAKLSQARQTGSRICNTAPKPEI